MDSDMNDSVADTVERLKELRKADKNGNPKHTQIEAAEKLGVSQSWVSQLETRYLSPPENDTGNDSGAIPSGSDSPNDNSDSNSNNGESSTDLQNDSENQEGDTMSDSESESDSDSSTESDEWVCLNCGNDTYYEPEEYVKKYGSQIDDAHVKAARSGDKICAECGRVE